MKLKARAFRSKGAGFVFGERGESKMPTTYRLGDTVRITTGPFACFTGKIEGINQAKTLLKVAVGIFGKQTPIALRFSEVEKLTFEPQPPTQ